MNVKMTVIQIMLVLSLCIVFTVGCSPYETKDPTAARIIMLDDKKAQTKDEVAEDNSAATPESAADTAPREQQ